MKTELQARSKAQGHANRYQKTMIIYQSGDNYTWATKEVYEKMAMTNKNIKFIDYVDPTKKLELPKNKVTF